MTFLNTNSFFKGQFEFKMSTVEEYFAALRETETEWPTYDGDFFPYNGQYAGHYWTGYFSSRPNYKR
jgi:hypothetical protein